MSDLISRADAIEAVRKCKVQDIRFGNVTSNMILVQKAEVIGALFALPSVEATKKKAELKENGDWDCPDVYCDECDHHRSVEWCSLAIPNHEEIDDTYKMVNEAFFEGFDMAEKQYRLLIETIEELDEKLVEAEWIPVSERLPNEDGQYLVYYEGTIISSRIDIMWYGEPLMPNVDVSGKHFYRSDSEWGDIIYDEVIAWKPLPKPYKEDSEVEE